MNRKNAPGDFDPGAMRFGNFINYYQFHPPVERTRLLPEHIWSLLKLDDSLVCLDVGCNCGDLTESLHNILQTRLQATPRATEPTQAVGTQQVKLLGVDIDSSLIDRANEKNTHEDIEYECLDVMEPHAMEYLSNYVINLKRKSSHNVKEGFHSINNLGDNENVKIFETANLLADNKSVFILESDKACEEKLTGTVQEVNESKFIDEISKEKTEEDVAKKLLLQSSISQLNKREATTSQRVSNSPQSITDSEESKFQAIRFQRLPDLTYWSVKKFDIVFCFSVTMWIHLNHGDKGLSDFLQKIVSLGKYLVMENQPWKCYRNAQRRIVRNSTKEKQNDTSAKDDKEKAVQILMELKEKVTLCYDSVMDKVCDVIDNNEKNNILRSDKELGNEKCLRNLDKSSKGSENICEENLDTAKEDVTKCSEITRDKEKYNKKEKRVRNLGRQESRAKKVTEEVGFKHYRELKLRSNVDKDIDSYLREKCNAKKLYESGENEWGRVITVYETL